MSTPGWRPPPCTCIPYLDGHHGIVLHADQVDDVVGLLTTVEDWLLHAGNTVHHDLHRFLTPAGPADRVRQLIEHLGGTASQISRAGHDPRLAWTPC